MIRKACLALSLLLAPTLMHAQARGAVVTGVVYDSVAHRPLGGAIVQAALVDTSSRNGRGERIFPAVADSAGRYRLTGLPRGTYALGFQHNSLAALGLESDLRIIEVAADSMTGIDLAIPESARVRAAKCPSSQGSDGMLAGFVVDATQGGTLGGAVVTLNWVEVAIVDGKLRTVPRRVTAAAGDDGSYLACGLASDTPLDLGVERVGYRDISGDITVPAASVVRRDFHLADTTGAVGRGVVVGRLTHTDGDPVHAAHASIPALNLDVPVVDGVFTITGVPFGTWQLEARLIGYLPQSVLIDVEGSAPTHASLQVDTKVQVLDAISVVGRPTGDVKVLGEINERSRVSFGTTFMPGNSWLTGAIYPADVLRAARGFSYVSMDAVRARGCSLGLSSNRRLMVYLDGRYVGGLEDLRNMISMKDVLAIEAYPDISSIPPLFQSRDACAVVAVWSRR